MSDKCQKSDQHATQSTHDSTATDNELRDDIRATESPLRSSGRARKLFQKARDSDKHLEVDGASNIMHLLRDLVGQLKIRCSIAYVH